MSSHGHRAFFQKLPDELSVKILTGICIANFASSCSDISDRVSQLSMSFPFKMPVKHLIMPAIPHLNDFLSFPAHWPALHFLKVYAAGTLYEVNLNHAMAFVRRYLLLHKAAAMGMCHPATLSALHKVSCHDTLCLLSGGCLPQIMPISFHACRDLAGAPGWKAAHCHLASANSLDRP